METGIIKTLEKGKLDLDKPKSELNKMGKEEGLALVEAGNSTAHERLIRIRQLKEFLIGVESGLMDEAKREVLDNGEHIVFGRAKIEVSNTGDRLDYEKDPIIADLNKQMEARKELVKLASKKGIAVADPVYSDMVDPVPVKIFGKETIKIQL